MARKRRPSRWASEASLQAFLRFNPEEQGLQELQRTAESGYQTAVRQARGTAQGIGAEIDRAVPAVSKTYDEAGLRQAMTAGLLKQGTGQLGGVANSIQAGIGLEQAVSGRQLNQGRATALTDLSSRKVAAKEGEAFAVNNAQSQLTSELTKLLQRKQSLRQEKGAFTALTTGQLQEAARKEAQTLAIAEGQLEQSNRNNLRTTSTSRDNALLKAETSRESAANKARGSRSASGAKLVSPDKHLEWQTDVQQIAQKVRQYKGKLDRSAIVSKLAKGRDAKSGYAYPNGEPAPDKDTPQKGTAKKPVPYKLGRVAPVAADLRMTAALDVELDGHLSRTTQKALQRAGFKVGDLNLQTYGQWKRRQARAQSGYNRPSDRGAAGYRGPN